MEEHITLLFIVVQLVLLSAIPGLTDGTNGPLCVPKWTTDCSLCVHKRIEAYSCWNTNLWTPRTSRNITTSVSMYYVFPRGCDLYVTGARVNVLGDCMFTVRTNTHEAQEWIEVPPATRTQSKWRQLEFNISASGYRQVAIWIAPNATSREQCVIQKNFGSFASISFEAPLATGGRSKIIPNPTADNSPKIQGGCSSAHTTTGHLPLVTSQRGVPASAKFTTGRGVAMYTTALLSSAATDNATTSTVLPNSDSASTTTNDITNVLLIIGFALIFVVAATLICIRYRSQIRLKLTSTFVPAQCASNHPRSSLQPIPSRVGLTQEMTCSDSGQSGPHGTLGNECSSYSHLASSHYAHPPSLRQTPTGSSAGGSSHSCAPPRTLDSTRATLCEFHTYSSAEDGHSAARFPRNESNEYSQPRSATAGGISNVTNSMITDASEHRSHSRPTEAVYDAFVDDLAEPYEVVDIPIGKRTTANKAGPPLPEGSNPYKLVTGSARALAMISTSESNGYLQPNDY